MRAHTRRAAHGTPGTLVHPPAADFRRVSARLRAFVVSALVLVAAPMPALAHGTLRSSEPAADARLRAAPRTLRLTFIEAPQLAFSRISLRAPDGSEVELAPLTVAPDDPRTLVTAVRGALAPGSYTVAWQTGGADGHPVRGSFAFVIEPGATGLGVAPGHRSGATGATPGGEPGSAVPAPGQAGPDPAHHDPESMPEGNGFGAESPLYATVRWLQYTGLLLAVGAAAFATLVLGLLGRKQGADSPMVPRARERAARLGLWGAGLVGIAAVLRLVAQSYAMHGAEGALSAELVGVMLRQTSWGWGWMLQVAAAIAATVGFVMARRGGSRTGWTLASVGALVLAFTPALASHAAASPRLTGLAIVSDGLHVLGAGGWLGSLAVVLAAGIPAAFALPADERGRAVADLINAFSPTALAFAGLVAATGLFAAWLHVGGIPALWQTTYGKLLLGKLAVLSVVVGTGAYNWLRVRPSLGSTEAAARIRRSSTLEVVVGVLVLVITAVLVATPAGADMGEMGM